MDNNFSKFLINAFPQLVNATLIRQFASPVPISPDTTFDIYADHSGAFLALVTTDYADPIDQSRELKNISGQHKFEFSHLIKPNENISKDIHYFRNDTIDGSYFLKEEATYYYLATLKAPYSSHSN